ncbi:hypothetical protein B0H14DRAFT_2556561 [Mycena olivaceomarginata]|nr:hypothetical protein B0H14DRAFT_2556561 [Mycena olivaceomarginata]
MPVLLSSSSACTVSLPLASPSMPLPLRPPQILINFDYESCPEPTPIWQIDAHRRDISTCHISWLPVMDSHRKTLLAGQEDAHSVDSVGYVFKMYEGRASQYYSSALERVVADLSLKTQPVTSISAPLHILVDSNKRPGLASVSAPVRTNEKVVYCSGYTISGRACRLRQGTASGKSEKWFCHHHINSVHAFRAFSSRNRKRSNSLACIPRFELDRISPMRLPEFIPAYLELTSQAALKVQMMQPISLDAPVGRTSFPVKTLKKMVAKPPTKTRSITSC